MIAIRKTATTLVALAATAALAPSAGADTAGDPPVPDQQKPQKIMRVADALARAGRPVADVAVLNVDTGVDLQHPGLTSRLVRLSTSADIPATDPVPEHEQDRLPPLSAGDYGFDLIGTNQASDKRDFQGRPILEEDTNPDDPIDGSGHGTAVAGIIGGVAPNARLVALRTCWDDQCWQRLQAISIDWAAANTAARVVTISKPTGPLEDTLRDAIRNHPEILFVTVPSGDDGAFDAENRDTGACGADSPNVLCVSTSTPDDRLDCGAYGEDVVDVAVPTRNNVTTTNGGGYQTTGCSTAYAAAGAAGVATILRGIDPAATPQEVKNAIVDSVRKAPEWQGRSVSGGIVDAKAAVELFQQRRGIAAPPEASSSQAPSAPAEQPQQTAPAPSTAQPAPTVAGPALTLALAHNVVRRTATVVGSLSKAATLHLTLERPRHGRRMGGTCKVSGRLSRRAPRCVRYMPVASLVRDQAQGTFSITVPLRRLSRGSYRLSGYAVDAAGNRSADVTAPLRVK